MRCMGAFILLFSFFFVMLGVFMGYSWGIHGVYVCIGYVSGMYRVCIGYVSEQIRKNKGTLAYLRVLYYLCRKLR